MSPPAPPPLDSTRTLRRTALRGASVTLDRRAHAFRRDLADVALSDRVMAANYVYPVPMVCAAERAVMRAEPRQDASPCSELLHGETFETLELSGAWAWGRSAYDGYVGYLPADCMQPATARATHRAKVRLALVFAEPSIKSKVTARLPMGARLAADAIEADFIRTERGFAHARHMSSLNDAENDPVTVAKRLLGAPYGWGGRSEAGVDCSGLVQIALMMCGLACPRDTDQQRAVLGAGVDPAGPLLRGDLVYFPGHVGIMADGTRLLHANAHWMACVIEPLADVVARLRPAHQQPVLAVRRLG